MEEYNFAVHLAVFPHLKPLRVWYWPLIYYIKSISWHFLQQTLLNDNIFLKRFRRTGQNFESTFFLSSVVKVGRVYSVSCLNTTSSNQEHDSEIDSAEGFSNPTTPIGHPSNRSIIVLLSALFASVSNPMVLTFFKRD